MIFEDTAGQAIHVSGGEKGIQDAHTTRICISVGVFFFLSLRFKDTKDTTEQYVTT